jgi:hypothetical protein
MVDIYRLLHPITRQHTFFCAAHGPFSKIDNILGHKASLKKYKKMEITPCIISDHNRIKLHLDNKRNPRKYSNTWTQNNTWLKNQWVTEVKREENKKFLESNENENTTYQNLCNTAKDRAKGKAYSYKYLHLKKKKRETSQINNLHLLRRSSGFCLYLY